MLGKHFITGVTAGKQWYNLNEKMRYIQPPNYNDSLTVFLRSFNNIWKWLHYDNMAGYFKLYNPKDSLSNNKLYVSNIRFSELKFLLKLVISHKVLWLLKSSFHLKGNCFILPQIFTYSKRAHICLPYLLNKKLPSLTSFFPCATHSNSWCCFTCLQSKQYHTAPHRKHQCVHSAFFCALFHHNKNKYK